MFSEFFVEFAEYVDEPSLFLVESTDVELYFLKIIVPIFDVRVVSALCLKFPYFLLFYRFSHVPDNLVRLAFQNGSQQFRWNTLVS